jgi:hypothetical protein
VFIWVLEELLENFSLYQVVGVSKKNKFELKVVSIKMAEGIKNATVSKRVFRKSILSVGVEIQFKQKRFEKKIWLKFKLINRKTKIDTGTMWI